MSWATRRVDSLCEQVVDCPHSTPKWTDEGVRVLRSKNIRGGRLDLGAQASFTTEEHYSERTKRAVPRSGDLVVTREAPMGEVCLLPDIRCCLGQRMVLLRPDDAQVDRRYMLYALQSWHVQSQIGRSKGTGTTVSNLRIPHLCALEIPTPTMDVQRRIADILSAYDDLIENNNRRMALLEESIHLLYREWFVYLRFPGHERVKVVDGVPEGWRRARLADLVEQVRQGIHPSLVDPSTPYIGLAHIPRRCIALPEWGTAADVASNKFRFRERDILFGKIRPYFHKVAPAPVSGICSSDTIVMRPHDPRWFALALAITSSVHFVDYVWQTAKIGAKMPRANWKVMRKYALLIPPDPAHGEFNDTVESLTGQIQSLLVMNRKLREARDRLLPRLMDGRIPV